MPLNKVIKVYASSNKIDTNTITNHHSKPGSQHPQQFPWCSLLCCGALCKVQFLNCPHKGALYQREIALPLQEWSSMPVIVLLFLSTYFLSEHLFLPFTRVSYLPDIERAFYAGWRLPVVLTELFIISSLEDCILVIKSINNNVCQWQ